MESALKAARAGLGPSGGESLLRAVFLNPRINRLKKPGRGFELFGMESPSGFAAALEGEAAFKNSPHLILAAPGNISKIKSFWEFKPPKAPCLELPAFSRGSSAAAKAARRGRIMWQAAARRGRGVFLASPEALLKKTAPPRPVSAKKGARLPPLRRMGYREKPFPEEPGDFSQRGFLCDVFSPAHDRPLRIELCGSGIESVSRLSSDFKRRERELKEAWLAAPQELRLSGADRQKLCQLAREKAWGADSKSLFFPQSRLLKGFSRGRLSPDMEALAAAGESACSLHVFPRPPWLWIFEPESARAGFEAAAAEWEREDPAFARADVFLPWEILTGDVLTGEILTGEASAADGHPAAAGPKKPPPKGMLSKKLKQESPPPAPVFAAHPPERLIFVSSGPPPGAAPGAAAFASRFKLSPRAAGGRPQAISDIARAKKTSGAGPAADGLEGRPRDGSPAERLKAALKALPSSSLVFAFQDPAAEKEIKRLLFSSSPASGAERHSPPARREPGFWEGKSMIFLPGSLKESFFSSGGSAYLQSEEILRSLRPADGPDPAKKNGASSFEFFRQRAKALEFSELEEGDLVAHKIHGVGEFSGLRSLSANGRRQDFFALLYKGGDRLLLPAHKAREIKRYSQKITSGARSPAASRFLLDRLGNPRRWEIKKSRAKKHIEALTLDLMELYRRRQKSSRPPFPPAESALKAFAADCPFELTLDQKRAIGEIFSDMDRPRPMDRLLCADAGFGKTEAALRAALRAMAGGFQVCFLAPTTVLSAQHYERFQERFKSLPFNIGLLNRFLPEAKRRETLSRLESGKIHLLAATHGAFSPKTVFKNLGLLIIDEEHRFGVRQKDRLLRLKTSMDALSLSATPIPRTLNMALSGIKDISALSRGPEGRLPVQTFIRAWDGGEADFLREACERETSRGGQILFIHNRIKTLPEREKQLRALLPGLRIASAHGRMKPSQLERVVLRFFRRKFDLLLSTNIVESGMDLPQANTLFIDRVHEMGLSRLYQLKGRVGRSSRQAYCYFLIPPRRKLPPLAEQRLQLIEKYGEAGGGYRLALYDLEMRGAGAVFGAEQSGHLHALGEELYFELLNEKLREKKQEAFVEPEVQLPASMGIPANYIPAPRLRLLYYKSLSEAEKGESLARLKGELLEAFGPFPEEMKNLFSLLKIRSLCKALLIRNLKARELKSGARALSLSFHEKTPVRPEAVIKAARRGGILDGPQSLKIPLSEKNWILEIEVLLRRLYADFV